MTVIAWVLLLGFVFLVFLSGLPAYLDDVRERVRKN